MRTNPAATSLSSPGSVPALWPETSWPRFPGPPGALAGAPWPHVSCRASPRAPWTRSRGHGAPGTRPPARRPVGLSLKTLPGCPEVRFLDFYLFLLFIAI